MTSTSGQSLTPPERQLEQTYKLEWGRLVSLLVARTRRLDLVEDALAEAFARAADRWPTDGMPTNPSGWLYTVAYRQVIGSVRAEAMAGRKAPLLTVGQNWAIEDLDPEQFPEDQLPDDRLHLVLLCCHPALARTSQSALALRLVLGTSTAEIARLFLVSTPTMAARLTRAKKKIVQAGIPLGSPLDAELGQRIDEVVRTIYLAFAAGYTPRSGPHLVRADLAGDAVRLAALLIDLVPQSDRAQALLALLLLQHSRRDARVKDGRLVTLANQNRSLWNTAEIDAGLALVAQLGPSDGYGAELALQARIAAEHARSSSADQTDWVAISSLYEELEILTGSAVVRLNRSVAVAEVEGPESGLAMLNAVADMLDTSHRYWAVRSDLERRAGAHDEAKASLNSAIQLCSNDVEREHLRRIQS